MLPLSPPVPIAATWSVATQVLTVTFNLRLRPGPTAPANWKASIANFPATTYHQLVPGTILDQTVTTLLAIGAPGAPIPDTCQYLAGTPDVLSHHGIPAAAFTNFPVVKI